MRSINKVFLVSMRRGGNEKKTKMKTKNVIQRSGGNDIGPKRFKQKIQFKV